MTRSTSRTNVVAGDGAAPIAKVWIEDGCIVCRECERICPQVFTVPSEGCVVLPAVDLESLGDSIRQAAALCPVEVIAFQTARPTRRKTSE